MSIEIKVGDQAQIREIVDWRAGSPIYLGEESEPEPELETKTIGVWFWVLKPGDLVCDWLGVTSPDNRGLLRLFVNLALYAKIVAIIALVLV